MLFDLRGRGRRRTVQVIYLSLALLMGGGLVLFGIGGGTNGGLFDAISGNGGSGTSADTRLQAAPRGPLRAQLKANPRRRGRARRRWPSCASSNAGTGENFDQTQQAYTDKGRASCAGASAAWQRYLALNPPKPDPTRPTSWSRPTGHAGLKQYDKAVQAMEIVIDARHQDSAASTPSSRSSPPAPNRTARATWPRQKAHRARARRTSASSSSREIEPAEEPARRPARPGQSQSG